MRSITTLLLIIFSLESLSTYAQTSSKDIERDVKMSGKYYYGEGIDSVVGSAREIAFDDLKLMILEKMMEENKELTNVDCKSLEDNFETIEIELEGRVKIVMFTPKSDLHFEYDGENRVVVSREEGVVLLPSTSTSTPTPEPEAVIEEESIATPIVETSETEAEAEVEALSTTPNSEGDIESIQKGTDPIIAELLDIKSYSEARHILNRYKYSGQLKYGKFETMPESQDCFLMILNSGDIVDILDSAQSPERVSLTTGKTTTYSDDADDIIWICIL